MESASLEKPSDAGQGSSGQVRRWLLELQLSDKEEKTWRKLAGKVLERYRGEVKRDDAFQRTRDTFNILWPNTETLTSSLYNSTPVPDVRRRFRDADPTGKIVAEILERSLSFALDVYDFDALMQAVVLDAVLPGRGLARVRYRPSFGPEPMQDAQGPVLNPQGEPVYPVVYEEVSCEHVQWDAFRRGPGKRWTEVPWIAFRHSMTREELVESFGPVGNEVKLSEPPDDDVKREEDPEVRGIWKTAEVWEIWDKTRREVLFLAKSYKAKPLKVGRDPLGLKQFFPIPEPLYSIRQTDSLVPLPEFMQYETLADELDRVTARINKIIRGLKLRGIYDSTVSEFRKLFEADDNELIPAENVVSLMEKGGLEKSIWMLDIGKPAQVLVQLYQYREVLKNAIYEITGISDILRGATVASESATAQNLKSQWGTLRLQHRQKEVARFCRDLIRLKAELIAEKFQPQTLMLITGLQFPSRSEQQALQMQVKTAEAMQQPVPPDMRLALSRPVWEDIERVLRDDALRSFSIDIETDSTIAAQLSQDQRNVTELLTATGQFMQSMSGPMQAGILPVEVVKELLLSILRRFKFGNAVEDALEKLKAPVPEIPKEIQAQIQQAQQQVQQAQQQNEKDRATVGQLMRKLDQDRDDLERVRRKHLDEFSNERESLLGERATLAEQLRNREAAIHERERNVELSEALAKLDVRQSRHEIKTAEELEAIRDESGSGGNGGIPA